MSSAYDSISLTIELRKWSTKAEIFSVGQPLDDTIGLPGGGIIPLWILGRKYICGVRGVLDLNIFTILSVMSPFSTIWFMYSLTSSRCFCVKSFSSFM